MKIIRNKYYIKVEDGNYKEIKDAKKYNNDFGLDLFIFIDKYGTNISEGKTGMKLFTGNVSEDAFINRLKNIGGITLLNALITANIEKYGYSPRYKEK